MIRQLTFDNLNPSVKAEDENRLSAQSLRLQTMIEARGSLGVTTAELAGCIGLQDECPHCHRVLPAGRLTKYGTQHNARMHEVRKALAKKGFFVDRVRQVDTGNYLYMIVPFEKSTFPGKGKFL